MKLRSIIRVEDDKHLIPTRYFMDVSFPMCEGEVRRIEIDPGVAQYIFELQNQVFILEKEIVKYKMQCGNLVK